MPENYIDRIVRAKLFALEVPLETADWDLMLERLNDSFYQIIKQRLESLELPLEEASWEALLSDLDEVFDQSIRQSLQTLSLTPQSEDWPMMASQVEGNPVDIQLAKKLHGLSFPLMEEDWAQLEAELDQDALLTTSRQLLSQHSIDFQPDDWALFEQQMDNALDHEIQEKLGSYELPLIAEDWASMASMLDGNSFDASVREAFDAFTVPSLSADWESMAEQLEAPFDGLVSTKLESLRLPVHSGDWRAMSQLLDREQDRVPFYVRWQSYAVAAAVALLLLFSGLGLQNNWGPTFHDPIDPSFANGPSVSPNYSQIPLSTSLEEDFSASDRPSNTESLVTTSPSQIVAATSQVTTPAEEEGLRISPIDQSLAPKEPPFEISDRALANADLPLVSPNSFDQSYPPTEKIRNISRIPVKDYGLATPLFRQSGLDLFDPMYHRSHPEVSIGWYGATTRTRAELNDVAEDLGYTTGLRIKMKINSGWHLITGFMYGKKSFNHKYPISDPDYPGFFGKVYGELTMVEVPLLMRYEFPEVKKFTIYGQAGMVTVVSLEETYENHDPLSPINASLISRRVDPDMLAAETHTWNLNTYPGNIHASIGLRYAISQQLSLELEPYFQQSLQRTKGSSSLRHRKKLYTSGIGASLMYTFPSK